MSMVIDANTFNNNYIIFQDTKINNIIDGKFTKFFYSTQYMVMTGIYIKLPLDIQELFVSPDKKTIHIAITQKNIEICKSICEIEISIINLFKNYLKNKKLPVFNINELFKSGNIKIVNKHKPYNISTPNDIYIKPKRHNFTYTVLPLKNKQHYLPENDIYSKTNEKRNNKSFYSYNVVSKSGINTCNKPILSKTYVIKISGIWENSVSYGLTYKILEHV